MTIKKQIMDSKVPEFSKKVYLELIKVPKGKVTTYGALAHKVGTRAYRGIGQVMNKNPFAPEVPCHRVIASDGSLNGFAHGLDRKEKMLLAEGVRIENGKVVEEDIIREL